MTHYLPVEPVGIGTKEVECLSSYIFRLAQAHGASRFQFITHLRSWWKRSSGHVIQRCEELRWNGYSPGVKLALPAFASATGYDVSPCSLAALNGICAGNYVGSVRHARHWCPACYREDLASRSFVFDRLVWQLQGYERCPTHRHALLAACANCGEVQRNDIICMSMHLCSLCGFDLSQASSQRHYRPHPCFGEAQMLALVAHLASSPQFCDSPLLRYLSAMEQSGADMHRMELLLGDLFHRRRYPPKPQLNSIVAVAVYFESDVIGLLTDPEEAARQTSLEFPLRLSKRKKRLVAANGGKRTEWFRAALRAVIDSPPPYPSLAAFCAQHDYSQSSANAFHRDLCKELIRKRQRWLENGKSAAEKRASQCARHIRFAFPSLTRRQLAARVAAEARVPIHISRRVCGATSGT